MRNNRKKIWINSFQTYLSIRIACYFLFYQVAVWCFVFLVRSNAQAMETLIGADATGFLLFFAATTVVFVGFLFTYDAVKYVHRIVGPIVRFRKAVQAITAGEEVELLRLRQGDFLQDFKDEFNAMLKALDERGAITLKTAPQDEKQPAGV